MGIRSHDKRLRPHLHAFGPLLGENEFPAVVPHGHEVPVIAEVDEFLPGPLLGFTLQGGQKIVAVQMHLEILRAGLVAF